MLAPSGEQFEIAFGDQPAVVTEVGGGLRAYSVGDRQRVDSYDADQMCASGRGQVLIPWPNRIARGHYEFGGREYQVPSVLSGGPHGSSSHAGGPENSL